MNLPNENDLKAFISDLYGYTVKLQAASPVAIQGKNVIAVFTDAQAMPAIVCVCEIQLANICGGALAMLPPAIITKNNKEGKTSDDVLDNFREVVNVTGGFFNNHNSVHVTLSKIFTPGEALPDDVKNVMAKPVAGVHYELELKNYGNGKISILAAQ